MADKRRWSQWALGNIQKCGVFYEKKHILNIRKPKPIAAIRGIAVHEQAGRSLTLKKDGEAPFTAEQAMDLASDAFDELYNADHRIDKDEVAEMGSIEKVRAFYKDETVALAELHADAVVPIIQPISVEEKIVVEPKGYDIRITTIIDVADEHIPARDPSVQLRLSTDPSFSEPHRIPGVLTRDLKTKRKAPNQDEAKLSQQITFESLGWFAKTGRLPDGGGLDFIWRTPKQKKTKHIFQPTKRTEDDLNTLLRRVQVATEAVGKGVFQPAPPESWFCSEKYCEYWAECEFGSGKRVQV